MRIYKTLCATDKSPLFAPNCELGRTLLHCSSCVDVPISAAYLSRMLCGNWYRLFSWDNRLVGVFLPSLFVAQLPQPTTPVSLLFSCISCNLLLPIKEYGEVHVEIRGSSHVCTGKCSDLYGEVHILRTGKFTSDHRFPKPHFA
jgi:hypothetical protein